MKIVLINPYGPLPNEGWRKYRNILLGEVLAEEKHDIVWYTSKFSHHFKKNREKEYDTGYDNFKVELISSKNYRNNISLNRLLFEITFCINLYFRLKKVKHIDLIIAADPSQFVGFLARILAKKYKSKLILDLMDEWPELFEKVLSGYKKILIKPVVNFFMFLRKKNYQKADGVIALGKNYLNIAKSISRKGTPSELIYNGVDVLMMNNWSKDSSFDLGNIKQNLKNNNIKCVYAGSLGMQGDNYDVEALLKAAIYFKDKNIDFYIAGSGEGKAYLLNQSEKYNLNNLFILGNLSAEKLARLYNFCDIGLALYGKGSNVDMPDKFYDYSSCGLAIISSLKGELKDVIEENNLGYYYEAGNYHDLNNKLSKLIENKELLIKCKKISKKIGLNYSIQTQFKKILFLIKNLNN
tara:strand:- start:1023 stop:2252 length:1230 start_codon:yes stop_codon:yes gene_type:complete